MEQKIEKDKPWSKTMEKLNEKIRRHKLERWKRAATALFLGFMMIFGTYLIMEYHTYKSTRVVRTYQTEGAAEGSYKAFGTNVLKYTKDGISLVNQKGNELWHQAYQIKNPMIEINGDMAALADNGGNNVMVFGQEGIRGEIATAQPIERIAVSETGIVAAILKDEKSPMVMCYDSVGNILVENKVSVTKDGYPIGISLSGDGYTMIVSYLNVQTGKMSSKVSYYHFGEAGKTEKNNQVGGAVYEEQIIPSVFFMDKNTSVLVGDSGFYIYEGTEKPELKKEVKLSMDIKSVFHTDKYIGLVLNNLEKQGYTVQLYTKSGRMTMEKDFTGDYSHAKMVGDMVMMYDGVNCSIYSSNGVNHFLGQFEDKILDIVPEAGLNSYMVMNINGIQKIRLVR